MSDTKANATPPTPRRTCAQCANWQPAEGRLYCRIHGVQLCNHEACTAYFRYAPQADNQFPAACASGTTNNPTNKD